ncbi:hypothetical protein AAG747_16720 [Rapidithrix thailandica]|uniref:Uncharacterized protein n=1 Tax=Rapidithrix thailandica TaxID=413964 RepID=A0AAW9RXF8_9BACT
MSKKLIHITLTLLVLIGTVGLPIQKHFCGELLQEVGLLPQSSSCCDMEDMDSDCCHNQVETLQIDDYHKVKFDLYFANVLCVLPSIRPFLVDLLPIESFENTDWVFYDPPLYAHDLPVWVQSFRL